MIYHYTSPEGLYSILKNSSIRFTDCQYMNDRSEYMYLKEMLFQALERCEHELMYKHYKELIVLNFSDTYGESTVEFFAPNGGNKKPQYIQSDKRHYVFCASMSDDSLGMWNYYTKDGNYQGYNLGFDETDLFFGAKEKSSGSFDYEIIDCTINYEKTKQESILIYMLKKIDEDICDYAKSYGMQHLNNYNQDSFANTSFHGRLDYSKYRLTCKHPAFADEREYRCVLSISDAMIKKHSDIFTKEFFVRNGIITPCCTLKFNKNSVKSISMSPTLEKKLVEHSIKSFLTENSFKQEIAIKSSQIPIRH